MKPLVDKKLKIKRKPQKGGWHYVTISGIPSTNRNLQGLVRVKGSIDTYQIRQFNLLPMKTGEMMFVLKAPLRKAIGKREGDIVHVMLFTDKSKVVIPEEILDSLLQSQNAYDFFLTLTESNKKYYLYWVN